MGDVVIAEGSRRIGCKRRVNASHVIHGTIYARGMRKSMLYEHNEDITLVCRSLRDVCVISRNSLLRLWFCMGNTSVA